MIAKIIKVLKRKSNIYRKSIFDSLNFAVNHEVLVQRELELTSRFLNLRNDRLSIVDDILSCDAIIFSKDRAIQLHALLDSYYKFVKNPVKPYILYTCSSQDHEKAYFELKEMYKDKVHFIFESDFRLQLVELLNMLNSEKVFFMTDDGVFVDHFDLNEFIKYNPLKVVVNFARGRNCDYCYTYNESQSIPSHHFLDGINKDDLLAWIWSEQKASPGFSYPLSLDGALFSRSEAILMFNRLKFRAPNTLEGNLQYFLPLFENRYGLSFNSVKYINVPINLVQNETKNIHTGLMDSEFLLAKWNSLLEIDYEIYEFMDYKTIQLSPYQFRKRK